MDSQNNTFPRALIWLLGIFLILVMVVYIGDKAFQISKQAKESKEPQKTISISAEGKVKAVPDLAVVNLGVITQGTTAAEVQDQNSKKINQIIDFVKQQGINKEDISTSNFNIYPQYDYRNGKNNITGYQANQTVSIKVRGVDKSTEALGKIIDGATNNGANEVNGVSLSFDDPDNLKEKARENAIERAKQKAQEMARVAGLTLGKVVSVSESNMGGYPVPMADVAYGMGGAGIAQKSISPNIEPGTQDITAQMTVVFEIK